MDIGSLFVATLQGGLGNLAAYLAAHDQATDTMFAAQSASGMHPAALAFLLVWVALLLAGTLKVGLLTASYHQLTLPAAGAQELQVLLDQLVPHDAAKGEEGVSVPGVMLILLLAAIGLASWRGVERVHEGYNRWTWIAMVLTALTLLAATLNIQAGAAGLSVGFTGKFLGVLLALVAFFWLARARASPRMSCAARCGSPGASSNRFFRC